MRSLCESPLSAHRYGRGSLPQSIPTGSTVVHDGSALYVPRDSSHLTRRLPPLVHQQQGTNECLPTAVGILVNVPKDEVIAWVRERLPHYFREWRSLMGCPQFWDASRLCLDHFLYEGAGDYLADCQASLWPEIQAHPDLNGRGLAIVLSNPFSRHAIVYDSWIIYDPEESAPSDFTDWRHRTGMSFSTTISFRKEVN